MPQTRYLNQIRKAASCFILAAAATLWASPANGATIQLTGGFVQQNSTAGFDGSFAMLFDVTGLPVGAPPSMDQNGPTVPISNVSISVLFANGARDSATNGSGSIYSMYNGYPATVFDYFSFSAGNISGLFALTGGYNGNGGVLLDDGLNSSLIQAGSVTGYLNNSASAVVTPEPTSLGFWCAAVCGLISVCSRQRHDKRNRTLPSK